MNRTGVDWRSSAWIVASALALLATSRWLSATSVEYLVLSATATAIAGALSFMRRGEQGRWALACSAALALAVGTAGNAQHQLARLERNWPEESARMSRAAASALAEAVQKAARDLRAIAARALDVRLARPAAFAALRSMASREVAVVLFHGDSARAWSGRPRVHVDSLTEALGIAATPFYLELYATARDGDNRAVATRLLYAGPPADRLARSMSAVTARSRGVAGFRFAAPADSAALAGSEVIRVDGTPLLAARADVLTQGEVAVGRLERARLVVGALLALALAGFVVAAWRTRRAWHWRLLVVGIGLLCVALTPLSAFSNYSRLFDPALYFTPLGGALTSNAAALALTSALVLLAQLAALRREARFPDRRLAGAIVLVVAGLGPFLLRDLARGIQIPPYGISTSLWLIWEVPLFLAAASVMLAGATAGSAFVGPLRGLSPIIAPALAGVAALIAPVVWDAPGQWPWWYTFLWVAAIASLAVSRRTSAMVVAASAVAALGATTLVWGNTTRARARLAEQDVAALGLGDSYARALAERLGDRFVEFPVASRRSLLETYATSDLAASGFPVWIASWQGPRAPEAILQTADITVPLDSLRRLVERASIERQPLAVEIPGMPAREHAIVVPTDSGIVTVVAAPKSRLVPPDPFARLLGIETPPEVEPPYTLQLTPLATESEGVTRPAWRRAGQELHADWVALTGNGSARVHAEVELRPLFALIQRGALIVLLNLAVVSLLWLLSVLADGLAVRWIAVRRRRWAQSYRIRLTLALFAFFMLPAIAFAVWSYQQLSTDAARARELLVRETLRLVTPFGSPRTWLHTEGQRLQSPLLLYRRGELELASDSLFEAIAPIGTLLDSEVAEALLGHGESSAHQGEWIGGTEILFGYRALSRTDGPLVLAAPARAEELVLGRRARDLGVLVLFATAVGALAALWLSGIAARQLARPIGSLRNAALALAGGAREPELEGEPTAEFRPVFAAFRRMVSDLAASRSALEEAQRRTATVLRNAASGVIAVDDDAVVALANPRAGELLGARLTPGTRLATAAPAELAALVQRFLAGQSDDEAFEMPHGEQQWRGRLTRLTRGGAVVTLDDVSEIARAQRVLAWGEMARQVAHEIKNPLTPIRLGVQHLKRARADQRVDFDHVLDQNVERILREIDRLDEIARAFSRYGQPPEQVPGGGAEPTDVSVVVRDVVELESMGEDHVRWKTSGTEAHVSALARRDELREVLLNVLENARLARATEVQISVRREPTMVVVAVRDDGQGIPRSVLPRIFEPHFSTRTSGSGLGLAVSRRLIESWGGRISISSIEGQGAEVVIELRAAAS